MIEIKKLWEAMPRDVQRKISCHDLKRIVDNLNSQCRCTLGPSFEEGSEHDVCMNCELPVSATADRSYQVLQRLQAASGSVCDCGGLPHGDHCAAVEAGIETSEWRCEECGQHAANCHHRQPITESRYNDMNQENCPHLRISASPDEPPYCADCGKKFVEDEDANEPDFSLDDLEWAEAYPELCEAPNQASPSSTLLESL